jgi:hypothetical protein
MFPFCSHQGPEQRNHNLPVTIPPQVRRGGAGGARTHDRQIMRKPARPPLVLAVSLHYPSVLVSQDLAEQGGIG